MLLANGTAIVQFTSVPAQVEPNETVDISVRYQLTGNSKRGPWEVKELSLYDEDAVFDDEIRSTSGSISQQDIWYSHTFQDVDLSDFADAGDGVELYAKVVIDDETFNGVNANDTTGVQRVTVGIPDLQVDTLTVSDSTVNPGDDIEITAVINNAGSRDAARSTVHYYFGSSAGSRDLFIGDGIVPNIGVLSPNEDESDSPTAPPQPNFVIPNVRGTYYITAVADALNVVNEVSESNNERSVAIIVGAPVPETEPVASLHCGIPTGPGVTVITHGFQLTGGPDSRTPDWTIEMAEAILDRNGSTGSILVHDPNLNLWVPPASRDLTTTWTNSDDLDDEIVLVFDWTWESNDFQNGWLEGAADSLFANLVAEFGFMGDQDHRLLSRPLHFIGHSRGTVVNSLAANRLAYHFPEVPISQFTTLDPHPSTIHKDPGHQVQLLNIPDNIQWADNYYREDGLYELDNDFNGVQVPGARNLQLDETVLQNAGYLQEHSDTHLWYLATIKDDANEVEGYSVNDDNFDDWWSSGEAYAASIEPASGRSNVGYARSRIGGSTLLTDQMDRQLLKPATQPASVFNGDFELGAELSNQIPGWERHGGGGSGNLDNGYLQLNDNDDRRTHNDLYLPPTATGVEFDYWINNNDVFNSNDRLEVLLGSDLIGSIALDNETGGFVRDQMFPLSSDQVGSVKSLEFRIGGSGDVQSAVRIDNVSLEGVQPPRAIDLDEIHHAIVSGSNDPIFDLNSDNLIDATDGRYFVDQCKTYIGDANRDGEFNSSDFISAFQSGLYEQGLPATWSQGDWNFDGVFNSSDLIASFQQGAYELGPNAPASIARPIELTLSDADRLFVSTFRDEVDAAFANDMSESETDWALDAVAKELLGSDSFVA